MPIITPSQAGNKNYTAFLDMLAISELGESLLAVSDNGYNVVVGSTAARPILFHNYTSHPDQKVGPPLIKVASTAAGRYQLLAKFFPHYQALLKLPDFGPLSQDKIALQQIRECHALPLLAAGDLEGAIKACNHIWASLTGSSYGQHTHALDFLTAAYTKAGGIIV